MQTITLLLTFIVIEIQLSKTVTILQWILKPRHRLKSLESNGSYAKEAIVVSYKDRTEKVSNFHALFTYRGLSRGEMESVFGHFTKFNIRKT